MDLVTARRFARRTGPSRVRDNDYFQFEGGINLVDSPLEIHPGQLLGCRNYEPGIRGGYTRFEGFERYDGRSPKPSEAAYWLLTFKVGTVADYPAIGDTVTGATSGATGVVLVDVVDAESDGSGYVVLGRVSGTFVAAESISFATVAAIATKNDAETDKLSDTYTIATQEDARALIDKLPGSGHVLGVAVYAGVGFAWRNNTGGTAAVMYRASATGWQAVTPSPTLDYDAGTTAFVEGETLTGATSGATAKLLRVVLQSGAWDATAKGYLVLGPVTGTFQDNETISSVSGSATANGTLTTHAFPADGRYETRVRNFYGASGNVRLYGVNGVGQAFEYDTEQFGHEMLVFLRTGMTSDKPNHLAIHHGQLWLSFPGGSIQRSGVGDPANWTVVLGAGEIGIGDECTGFLEEVAQTLFVFARNSTRYIAGDVANGYTLETFNFETGAFPYTIQRIGQGMYLDDRGLTTLATSDRFGNYLANTFSDKIQPLLNQQLKLKATASVIARSKNLYRIFFSDNRMLVVGLRAQGSEQAQGAIMTVTGTTLGSYDMPVRCAISGEDATGAELLLFGSDDGFVYQADKGMNFDGKALPAFARLAFHHSGSPARRKRYRFAQLDIEARSKTTMSIATDYSFANPDESGQPVSSVDTNGGGGFWDVDNWNEFVWSAGVVANARLKLEGSGTNIGILVSHTSTHELPHTLHGVVLAYSLRRMNRGT